MNVYEVVKKLIGEIEPVGESHIDERRLENLKAMTELSDSLLSDIEKVAFQYKNNHQYSMKQASEFAEEYLSETVDSLTP